MEVNDIGREVVDAAIAADPELGPGMMKTGITRTVNGLPK